MFFFLYFNKVNKHQTAVVQKKHKTINFHYLYFFAIIYVNDDCSKGIEFLPQAQIS